MSTQKPPINPSLVQRLIAAQFPQWHDLPIRPVATSGWDNRTFHLGDDLLVRLPSAACYAAQVPKEQRWLPYLAPQLPLQIPAPIACGEPSPEYPWQWSVFLWLPGESACQASISDHRELARSLAQFLNALHRIDTTDGPAAGKQSFYRGDSLSHYDAQARESLKLLLGKINTKAASMLWDKAMATTWTNKPVWVHGDLSAGNLLVASGKLYAVIDFGQLAVGDPACDLAIAWTLFEGESRDVFRAALPLDADTWLRGAAWTLWKYMLVAAKQTDWNAVEAAQPTRVIEAVLKDFHRFTCN